MERTWVLLSEARKKLLHIWNIGTILAFLFLLAQQMGGMLTGIEPISWGWFLVCFVPGLLLLNLSSWINRRTEKIIPPAAYSTIFWLVVTYKLLLFFILFASRAIIDTTGYGLDIYYQKTIWIVSPFNFILNTGFLLVFYSRESKFKPSSTVLLKLAQTKAYKAKRDGYEIQNHLYDKIRENKLDIVFEEAGNWFKQYNIENYQLLILLQSRYNSIRQMMDLHTVTLAEAQIELNKITITVIELIDKIKA